MRSLRRVLLSVVAAGAMAVPAAADMLMMVPGPMSLDGFVIVEAGRITLEGGPAGGNYRIAAKGATPEIDARLARLAVERPETTVDDAMSFDVSFGSPAEPAKKRWKDLTQVRAEGTVSEDCRSFTIVSVRPHVDGEAYSTWSGAVSGLKALRPAIESLQDEEAQKALTVLERKVKAFVDSTPNLQGAMDR